MSYPAYGTGSNFAVGIVIFLLLIIAGVGLFYLLRTLTWSGV